MPRRKTTASTKPAPALRRRAEELAKATIADVGSMSAEQVRALAYELQVRQIELELQSEELRAAQGELAEARDRVVLADASELHRAEQGLTASLRRSEESEVKLRAAFDNAPFEFWIRDAEGRCILENAAAAKHWGDQIGKRVEDTGVPEYVAAVWQANNRRAFAGEVVEGEVEYGCDGECRVYHNIIAPFRFDGEIRGIVGFNIDITERKRAEDALQDRLALEQLLAGASSRLINVSPFELDAVVHGVLADVGRIMQVDRCFVLRVSDDQAIVDTTHEWCAPDIPSQLADARNLPTTAFPWMLDRMQGGESLLIARVADLPPEAAAERQFLADGYIQSVILVPIRHAGKLTGLIGADAVRAERQWSEEDSRFLRTVGELLTNAQTRCHAEAVLVRHREQLEELVKERTAQLENANAGLQAEIAERQRAEKELAERAEAIQILHDVASMANQTQDLQYAIECCLQWLTNYSGWRIGHALLPDGDDRDILIPTQCCPHGAPDRFSRFRETTLGTRFRRGEGLPGRVFASGEPLWITEDLSPLLPSRAVVAEELGIRTAVAFPVLVGDQVAAVLEFFSDKLLHPDERSIGVMAGTVLQLGRVIERANFEEHLLEIPEEVQRAIAQDLHDDVGQEITGLALKATTLAEMLASSRRPAARLAADIDASVVRTQAKVRGLSRRLLPVELEEGMLAVSIGQLAAAVNTDSRIACTFDCGCTGLVLDSRTATHLYRIAQEAVSNALRHGDARSIRIVLEQQNGDTVLRIEDDGTGLPRDAVQASGMGLRTMRYRAGLIGGALEVGPGASGGVLVLCRLTPRNANLDA